MPPLWRGADVGGRLDRVAAVIAPSRFLAGLARPSFRCPVVHLPNFAPDANPRGRVEVPSDDVLYVGVLERHKGVAELAEAAGRIRALEQLGRDREARAHASEFVARYPRSPFAAEAESLLQER